MSFAAFGIPANGEKEALSGFGGRSGVSSHGSMCRDGEVQFRGTPFEHDSRKALGSVLSGFRPTI